MTTSSLWNTGLQRAPFAGRGTHVGSSRASAVNLPAVAKAARTDGAVVFGVTLAVYLAAGWLTATRLQLFLPSTMMRTAQVMQLLSGQQLNWASIGFDSAPLLLLALMPFTLLPVLNHAGLAAATLSALSAAAACAGVLVALQALGLKRRLRLLAMVPVGVLLLLPAATGVGGTMALAFGIWSLLWAIRWWRGRQLLPLVVSSFSLTAACLASPLALIQAVLMAFVLRKGAIAHGGRPGAAQALNIAYLTPVAGGVLLWLLVCLVAGGNPATMLAQRDSAPASHRVQWSVPLLGTVPDRTDERSIAAYLAKIHHGRDVLIDDHSAYPVLFFSEQPGWFATSSDADFQQMLEQPAGRVRYILLANPALQPKPDVLNQTWPRLFEDGAEWVSLDQQWGANGSNGPSWKLFRVAGTP